MKHYNPRDYKGKKPFIGLIFLLKRQKYTQGYYQPTHQRINTIHIEICNV